MAISLATIDGGGTTIDDTVVADLRSAIRGNLTVATDPGHAGAPVFNAMHASSPALVVRCTGTADVVDAVTFARRHRLLAAVRGGGHSIAGHSSCAGGMIIDLGSMRAVDVDPDARVARVQGGAVWADVDRETQALGLAVPGGVVSTTGVAGLTLGGGIGWLRRKYGLTSDSLLSARIVCADGSIRTASPAQEPDLFWAIRGGGGNFGIVTSFEFRAYPLGPIVAFAAVFYPIEDATPVLRRWRDYCASTPDEVTSVAAAVTVPAGDPWPEAARQRPCMVITGLYAGPAAEGMAALQPLRELGTALADISQPMPYTAVQTVVDPLFPMGVRQAYWKAQNLASLPDDAIDVIVSRAKARPTPLTQVVTFQMGGAINRIASGETAYAERSARWMSSIDGTWDDAAGNSANIAWVRESFRQISPYATGTTYTNFTGRAGGGEDAPAATAYGTNIARLRLLKARYDPDNFFRLNANITPVQAEPA